MLEDKFYIYQHTRNDTGEVFYVGKGHGKRAYELNKGRRNKHWQRIVDKHGYTVEIIEDKLSEDIAFQKEIALIKSIGRASLNEGPLINKTDGGEGSTGRVVSQAEKDKRNKKLYKPVINDLGEIFESIGSASCAYNVTHGKISMCCNGKIPTAISRKWDYYAGDISSIVFTTVGVGPKNKMGPRAVINDLNEVFENMELAANSRILKSTTGILACCKGRRKTAGGRKWQYYIED